MTDLTFITPYITKEILVVFFICWIASSIIKAATVYALNTSENNEQRKIATKNFHMCRFYNKIFFAIPLFCLALKMLIH